MLVKQSNIFLIIADSLPQVIKLFLAHLTNNADAMASKYDSVEKEESETGNAYIFPQLLRHKGRVLFQRKRELH